MPIELKEKIALFCDVPPSAVVQNGDAPTIYQVPLNLEAEGLARPRFASSNLPTARAATRGVGEDRRAHPAPAPARDHRAGRQVRRTQRRLHLDHRGAPPRRHLPRCGGRDRARRLGTRSRTKASACSKASHGILVAPGLRRARRQRQAARDSIRARTQDSVPGHLLRHAAGVRRVRAQRVRTGRREDERSRRDRRPTRSSTSCPISATSRSTAARCAWAPTAARSSPIRSGRAAYGELEISERHRHRYEFNNRYRPLFEEHGMRFSGHHTIGKTRWSK